MAAITQKPTLAPHLLSQVGNQVSIANNTGTDEIVNVQKPRDVLTTLNYYKDPPGGGPPAILYANRPETFYQEPDPRQITVHDIRGSEDQYTLDTTGFQIVKHQSIEKDFLDDEQIKATYYPEVENLLKQATGAARVLIFDHTIRREKPSPPPSTTTTTGTPSDSQTSPAKPAITQTVRGPVQRVHIDQTYKAGSERVTHHLPAEAPTLLLGRHQIINTWRPIKTIYKDPLAVATASSVPDTDLVVTPFISETRNGETYAVRPSNHSAATSGSESESASGDRVEGGNEHAAEKRGHVWNYLFEQTPEEVLLIKCFDSKTDGRARRAPHSAFVDEEFEAREARESIEVRALVFHPEDRD